MKKILIIILLLLISSVSAQEFNYYEKLKIKTHISSSLILEKESASFNIKYVYANLTFIPNENEFQKVTYTILTDPKTNHVLGKESVYVKWDNPNENELKLDVYAQEENKVNFKHINKKIKFPIEESLNEFQPYLISSETVTSNDPLIISKANELAQGEDDLFELVYKIGLWTKNNINYSLETLTAEVSQNASWVLENKFGVCDELTSLFVSLLRSLNIPARFVTGQSYTNLINDFGNHAWAEVYFPGYGWIPFDPTYGQLGYVDSTHIKMKTGQDVKESDIIYGWLSNNVNVKSSGLKVESEVIDLGGLYTEDINVEIEALKKDIGENDNIPIKINIKNPNNYYLPISLYITKAPVKIDDFKREVLLKPNEEKSVFFIVKTPEELKKGFTYTSKLEITDNYGESFEKELSFSPEGNPYSLEEAQEIVDEFVKENDNYYSKNLNLDCKLDKSFYYEDEIGKLNCDLYNKGDLELNELNVCYNKQCKMIILDSKQGVNLDFNFDAKDEEFFATASNTQVNKVFIVNPGLLKNPKLKINLLGYPSHSSYFNDETIKINLNVNSPINNIDIFLNNKKIYSLDSFSNEQNYDITLKAYNLKDINKMLITYEDKNGIKYSSEEVFNVVVEKPFIVKYMWIFIILLISMILLRMLRSRRGSRS